MIRTGHRSAKFVVMRNMLLMCSAVAALHAQAKSPVFFITEIDVTNPEGYRKEFAPKMQATIA
jgi:hypothetical protein